MPSFSGKDLLMATGGKLLHGSTHRRVRRVCTDSRIVGRGDLFVALKGEQFDGHQFVKEVLERGAAGVLVEETLKRKVLSTINNGHGKTVQEGPLVIGVEDTLTAYQELAACHRRRFDVPVVAVTGSNGKTTTKEMVASTLTQRWRVLKTAENFNNRIGVPQTVFRLTKRHEVAVVEMGVDHEGQTTRLCEIAQPTLGVITNIGPDHLEFFGDVEGSARAKAELLACLPNDGTIVLNADDRFYRFLKQRSRCRVVSFGLNARAHVQASHVGVEGKQTVFRVHVPGRTRSHRIVLHVHGVHNVSNALAAVAVGYVLGMSVEKIAAGLSRFRPVAMRSQIRTVGGCTVIQDSYNANPASMKAAVDLLMDLGKEKRTIAILGDMLELGANACQLHREVGWHVAEKQVDILIASGELGKEIAQGARERGMASAQICEAQTVDEASTVLREIAGSGDVVLLKASRGMRLERVLEGFSKRGSVKA